MLCIFGTIEQNGALLEMLESVVQTAQKWSGTGLLAFLKPSLGQLKLVST